MNPLLPNPANFLLLLVDDQPANLKVLNGILSVVGYKVTFANNGKQALQRLEQIYPDLILLDLMMPEMDGLEVAEYLSNHPQYQEIPIIFLTAIHEKEYLTKAFEKGAVDYLTKPFEQEELLARIQTHLKLKYYRDSLYKQIQQEKLITQITHNILGDLDLKNILQTTVLGLKELFQADRVMIHQCQGIEYCHRIAEATNLNLSTPLEDDKLHCYCNNMSCSSYQCLQITNLNHCQPKISNPPQHLAHLNIQTELYLSLKIQSSLWGTLIIHHFSHSYQWSEQNLTSLEQILKQTQVAIQQAELYQKLQNANQELEQLAYYDGLTQIPNRRQFNITIEQEWLRLRRETKPLSLIMCDVDYFKPYNDTYGHPQGDTCLYKVAQTLEKTIKRPADMVARYGGEEFVIILPNTPEEGMIQLANRIQTELLELNLFHCRSPFNQITLSMGLSTIIPTPEMSLKSFIERADEALYMAKFRGRNQWHVWDQLLADEYKKLKRISSVSLSDLQR